MNHPYSRVAKRHVVWYQILREVIWIRSVEKVLELGVDSGLRRREDHIILKQGARRRRHFWREYRQNAAWGAAWLLLLPANLISPRSQHLGVFSTCHGRIALNWKQDKNIRCGSYRQCLGIFVRLLVYELRPTLRDKSR